jgi:sugar phosphate isomerase/epimerase
MMTKAHSIKRAASLYSFQEEYFLGKLNLEDLLATCQQLDIPGVEIIGEQMIPGYPHLPDAFFEQWHGWMDQYGLTPVCLDQFIFPQIYKGRRMTEDEMVASLQEDIRVASRLGCSIIRVQHSITSSILERALPAAEKAGISLDVEIHAPNTLEHPFEQELIRTFERMGSPYLGFVLDLGIFTSRFPRIITDAWLRKGMKPEIADFISDSYDRGQMEQLEDGIRARGGTQDDLDVAFFAKHLVSSDPRKLLPYMQYIHHVHAKFNDMTDEGWDDSIRYEEIIPVLVEGGFSGYLSSEYEGGWYLQDAFVVDAVEQVRRHQLMLKHLLGEDEQAAGKGA